VIDSKILERKNLPVILLSLILTSAVAFTQVSWNYFLSDMAQEKYGFIDCSDCLWVCTLVDSLLATMFALLMLSLKGNRKALRMLFLLSILALVPLVFLGIIVNNIGSVGGRRL
jgi:hypothetical protein